MSTNEHTQWRKFLQPLVTGLVALVAALTLYVQRSDNDRTDSRLTAIEVRMDAGDKRMDASDRRSDKFGADIDNFKVLLGDIRSDVSYIRAKLEDLKDAK